MALQVAVDYGWPAVLATVQVLHRAHNLAGHLEQLSARDLRWRGVRCNIIYSARVPVQVVEQNQKITYIIL